MKPFSLLHLSNKEDMPTAVPLLVPCNYDYYPDSHTIVKRPQASSKHQKQYLVPQTLELLKNVVKPVAVLSICGPYRSGKSYFLSRVLGIPNAFDISHTMKACTRGIWMATTALECDDFVVVFLDTEGTDDVGASENATKSNFSLLVLTTLLSSCLIYNSMNIPKRTDLEAMSFLAQLSSTITSACDHKEEDLGALQWHFPSFLWLLRDVLQTPVNDEGEKIPLTTYVKEQVFTKSSSKEQENVIQVLLNLFPSFECQMLPIPTLMPDVLENITENQENLSPLFNKAVDQIRVDLLKSIKPKRLFGSETSFLTGPLIASLATKYFEVLNTPDALPKVLSNSQLLLEHEITTVTDKLVEEYKSEMEEALREKLPMEAVHQEGDSDEEKCQSLMDIHQDILDQKVRALQIELSRQIPVGLDGVQTDVLLTFKKRIVQYKEPNDIRSTVSDSHSSKVTGGELFRFVQENEEKSRRHCVEVFEELSTPLIENLSKDFDTFEQRYYLLAIGPAKDEVYVQKREQFDNIAKRLASGPPTDLRAVGRGSDRIKLAWTKPTHHRRAVMDYEVQLRRKHKWITIINETRRHSLMVLSLKPSTTYHFRVRGNNTFEVGQWSEEAEIRTRLSTGERYGVAAASFVGRTLIAPIDLTLSTLSEAANVVRQSRSMKYKVFAGAGMVIGVVTMLPVIVGSSAVMAPEAGAEAAHDTYTSTGIEEDDDLDISNCERVDLIQVLNRNDANQELRGEILSGENDENTPTEDAELTNIPAESLTDEETALTTSHDHSTLVQPQAGNQLPESRPSSDELGYIAESESDETVRHQPIHSKLTPAFRRLREENFSTSFVSSNCDSENPPQVCAFLCEDSVS